MPCGRGNRCRDSATSPIWRKKGKKGENSKVGELNEYYGENMGWIRFFGATSRRLRCNKSSQRSKRAGFRSQARHKVAANGWGAKDRRVEAGLLCGTNGIVSGGRSGAGRRRAGRFCGRSGCGGSHGPGEAGGVRSPEWPSPSRGSEPGIRPDPG